jgi:hypothetical protein
MDYLTPFISPSASNFVVGLGKLSFHSSYKNSLPYGRKFFFFFISTRFLKMAFLPIKETYFGTPTTSNVMAFPLVVVTKKGCLV